MASDRNSVELTGNLVRDPELKGNGGVCKFSIASNRFKKTDNGYEKETSYFDVVVFGNTAHEVKNNLAKGNAVEVKGRLKQSSWTGQDGKPYSRIEVVANSVIPIQKEYGSSGQQAEPRMAGGNYEREAAW